MIVVIPWRHEPARVPLLEWVLGRWRARGVEPRVGEITGEWCKADAVNQVLRETDTGPLVVSDADVWCDTLIVPAEGWAVPHYAVHRLTKDDTALVLAGTEPHAGMATTQRPYRGFIGGGLTVLADVSVWWECPLDPRFRGWGQEDESWGHALTTLYGQPQRGESPLWHLWHPPQVRRSRSVGNRTGLDLVRRYRRVAGDREAVRTLLGEIKDYG